MKVITKKYCTHVLSKDNPPCARILPVRDGVAYFNEKVNPMKTVRMELPRHITSGYGFDSFSVR